MNAVALELEEPRQSEPRAISPRWMLWLFGLVLVAGAYFALREPTPKRVESVKVEAATGGGRVEVMAVKPPDNPVLSPVLIDDAGAGADVDPNELAPLKAGGTVAKVPPKASVLRTLSIVFLKTKATPGRLPK